MDDSTTGFLQAIQRQCDLQVLRLFRETEWRIGATLLIHHASFSTSLRKVFRGYEGFNFELVNGEYMYLNTMNQLLGWIRVGQLPAAHAQDCTGLRSTGLIEHMKHLFHSLVFQ